MDAVSEATVVLPQPLSTASFENQCHYKYLAKHKDNEKSDTNSLQSPETEYQQPQKWPIGTKVQKCFTGYGVFVGKVVSYEGDLYKIEYSDGDTEDFDHEDMERHLYLLPTVDGSEERKSTARLSTVATSPAEIPTLAAVVVTPPPSVEIEEATDSPRISRARKRLKMEDEMAVTAIATPPSAASIATATSFGALYHKHVAIHTLIVGTYPAMQSFAQQEYFAKPANAFWWIAGDCLGFRRAGGELSSRDGDISLCQYLRYGKDHSIPYPQQVDILCSKGFALWDVLATCKRTGSLDRGIQSGSGIPNDIRGFVKHHPTIQRIVFASGKSTARYFNMNFKEWWKTGELAYYGDHPYSVEMFQKMLVDDAGCDVIPNKDAIVCVCAKSVSPADAKTSYIGKRQFWEDHVYAPGLDIHNGAQAALGEKSGSDEEKSIFMSATV